MADTQEKNQTWQQHPHESGKVQSLIVRTERRRAWLQDIYARMLRAQWRHLLLLFATIYFVLNALFASILYSIGPCIQGNTDGSWLDTFFFSVQTFSTIGYGGITPKGLCGNLLVTIESWLGIIVVALTTGIIFAKFSRPTARVIFSHAVVTGPYNGKPCLMFRVGNKRDSNIIEASIRVTAVFDDTTIEGEHIRRLQELKLMRRFTPLFIMSWTVIHPLSKESLLYGQDLDALKEKNLRLIVSMTGIDGVFSQTVHAHYIYFPEAIKFQARFVDIITPQSDGTSLLDFTRFHETLPLASEE